MRIAAIYDIHGNLPALDAVLREIEAARPGLSFSGKNLQRRLRSRPRLQLAH